MKSDMKTKNIPFNSHKVITEQISEADLKTYLVGFDLNDEGEKEYRLNSLVQILLQVIPEFAFGHHEGESTPITESLPQIIDAAKSIYKIKEFEEVKNIYEQGNCIEDDVEDKYLRRGEFGELILHLILRDFHNTIPLISKIYFKDSYGSTVHGFDAIHIQPESKTLWLGESKLYINPKNGLKALIGDIKEHFKQDYLNDEFAIITKKIKHFGNIPDKDHWINIMNQHTKLKDVLKNITIPLICTYTSSNFSKFADEELEEFKKEYEKEMRELKKYFDDNNDHPLKTNLNIIILLFPLQCKKELVKEMHKKLSKLQEIGK